MFVLGGLVCATWLSAQDYQKTAYGIKAAAGGVDVEVQFFTPSVVRVVKSPQGEHFEKKSLAVVASPGEVGVKVGIKDGAIVMDTKVLQVNLDTSTGAFSYRTADGKFLLAEKPVEKPFVPFDDAGDATYNVYQAFKLDADEAIYGLGQLQNGKMSQRGAMACIGTIIPPRFSRRTRKRPLSGRMWAIAWIITSCTAAMQTVW